ncbi:Cytochrome c oxidase assembly protein cox15 [Linderina pennispora]|nr:Cytochrome c oxidase assembly protein cox15 [Linderina pennispora]
MFTQKLLSGGVCRRLFGRRLYSGAADPLIAKIDPSQVSSTATGNWLLFTSGLSLGVITANGLVRTRDATLVAPSVLTFRIPRSEEQWTKRYLEYAQTGNFRTQHAQISMDEFKQKYWAVMTSRSLTMCLAAGYFVPLVFLLRGRHVARKEYGRIAANGALVLGYAAASAQVQRSGNNDSGAPSVGWQLGQVTLGYFLFSDMLIYGLGVLRTRRLLSGRLLRSSHFRQVFEQPEVRQARLYAVLVEHGIVCAGMAGVFMASTNAGQFYPDWPLTGQNALPWDDLVASGLRVWENPAAVTLVHRLLGEGTGVLAVATWIKFMRLRQVLPGSAMVLVHAMLGMTVAQIALGVTALWTTVHPHVSLVHETNSYLLLAATILVMNSTKRLPPNQHLGKLIKSLSLPK